MERLNLVLVETLQEYMQSIKWSASKNMLQLVYKGKSVTCIAKTRMEAQLVQLGNIAFGVRHILDRQRVM